MSIGIGFNDQLVRITPASWSFPPLKYSVTFRREALSELTDPNYCFRYVDISSVEYGKGIISFEETRFADAPSRARKKVRKNDVILSTVRTYLKAIAPIADDCNDLIVSTGFSVITPKHYVHSYLYYLLQSDAVCEEINRRAWGIAYPAVTEAAIGEIKSPCPPISEQVEIVRYLDTRVLSVDKVSQLLSDQIDLLERYKKSLILKSVTKGLDPDAPMKDSGVEWIGNIPQSWETRRLKYICAAWNGLTYDPADLSDEGTPVLRAGNIQDGKLDLDDLVYVSGAIPNKAMIKPGDVLICSRNGSRRLIGKNAYIVESGFAFGAFMMVARTTAVDSRYFYYLLNSGVFDFYLPTYLTSTVNQLTGTNFGNMVVPITFDRDEQEAIVSYLDAKCSAIDLILDRKREQLEILRKYRQSIIYEYVTGKRRVGQE